MDSRRPNEGFACTAHADVLPAANCLLKGSDQASCPLLAVRHLSVSYHLAEGTVHAVKDVSLDISHGETLALAGETGSGKSTLALALLGLLEASACTIQGEILLEGQPIQSFKESDWRKIRSRKIGMIFQDTRSALNPSLTVLDHLMETLLAHQKLSRKAAREKALELLKEVGLVQGDGLLYSFELSGGMCQRVGIALGICNNPRLLIADEPTSAVDSTLQAQILDLLAFMKDRHALALLLISHDLSLLSQVADRVAVMYHGRVVELGKKKDVFEFPAHPYTRGLIQCQPDFGYRHDVRPLIPIPGMAPAPSEDPQGCVFASRCSRADPRCLKSAPPRQAISDEHWVACIRAKEI